MPASMNDPRRRLWHLMSNVLNKYSKLRKATTIRGTWTADEEVEDHHQSMLCWILFGWLMWVWFWVDDKTNSLETLDTYTRKLSFFLPQPSQEITKHHRRYKKLLRITNHRVSRQEMDKWWMWKGQDRNPRTRIYGRTYDWLRLLSLSLNSIHPRKLELNNIIIQVLFPINPLIALNLFKPLLFHLF